MKTLLDKKQPPLCADKTARTTLCHEQMIEGRIREFITHNLLFSEDGFPYRDEESFLQQGVIDSLGVLELVTFVGREFGVQVESMEVTPDNFDSVDRLAGYIRRKSLFTREGKDVDP